LPIPCATGWKSLNGIGVLVAHSLLSVTGFAIDYTDDFGLNMKIFVV
jgi:hypothetical protein